MLCIKLTRDRMLNLYNTLERFNLDRNNKLERITIEQPNTDDLKYGVAGGGLTCLYVAGDDLTGVGGGSSGYGGSYGGHDGGYGFFVCNFFK